MVATATNGLQRRRTTTDDDIERGSSAGFYLYFYVHLYFYFYFYFYSPAPFVSRPGKTLCSRQPLCSRGRLIC